MLSPEFDRHIKFGSRHVQSVRLLSLPGMRPVVVRGLYKNAVVISNPKLYYKEFEYVGLAYFPIPPNFGHHWIAFACTKKQERKVSWCFKTLTEAHVFMVDRLTPYSLTAFIRQARYDGRL